MKLLKRIFAPGSCVGCGDSMPGGSGLCGACVMAETSKTN